LQRETGPFEFNYSGVRGKPLPQVDGLKGRRSIAKELCLSVKTISNYRVNILWKTRMKNDAEITYYPTQNKPAG